MKGILDIFNVDDFFKLPDKVMSIVCGDIIERNQVYNELIDIHSGDMSFDWFQKLYEEEFSQRKELKQDFTPPQVCGLVAKIVGQGESTHEPTAGSGGMMISKWWNDMKRELPWDYKPSNHIVDCWELSDRSIPFLLLNLSIRGIMGYVTHGDILTLKIKHRYALLNRKDDPMSFSEVIEIGPNEWIGKKI